MKNTINNMHVVRRSLFTYVHTGRMQLFFLMAVTTLTAGCFQQYYKTNTRPEADAAVIQQMKAADKYFIIHYVDKIMAAQNLSVTNEVLEADLQALPKEHARYTSPTDEDRNPMKAKYKATTLTEVHLYTDEGFNAEQMHIALPVVDINRMDIYELDAKATRESRVLSIIGVSALAFVLTTIILLIANPPLTL